MNTLVKHTTPQAQKVWFTDVQMYDLLSDERELAVPLEWFPVLRDSTEAQRMNWRLIGNGVGISSWEKLNEDLSIAGLL